MTRARRTRATGCVVALVAALALVHCVAPVSARKIYPGPGSTPKSASGGGGDGANDHDAAGGDGGDGDEHVLQHGEEDDRDHNPYNDPDWLSDYGPYGDFNVTQRLEEIFPLMDIDHDGHISKVREVARPVLGRRACVETGPTIRRSTRRARGAVHGVSNSLSTCGQPPLTHESETASRVMLPLRNTF